MKPRTPVSAASPLPPKLSHALKSSARSLQRPGVSIAVPTLKSGATLRPGKGTPLWNALVSSVQPRLKARGAQSELARALGLRRQQVNAFFSQQTRMPDAERTLQLLAWLSAGTGK